MGKEPFTVPILYLIQQSQFCTTQLILVTQKVINKHFLIIFTNIINNFYLKILLVKTKKKMGTQQQQIYPFL